MKCRSRLIHTCSHAAMHQSCTIWTQIQGKSIASSRRAEWSAVQEFKAKQNGGASTESILDPPTSIAGASSPSDSPGSSGPGSRRVDRQLLKQLVAALQDIASSDPPPARGMRL